jgi:NAD(P)-dependent dehydrogenase (short-subunit alcohol dehydrogenase family)
MSNNHGQKLAGKIAVITGGNSGIGLATAKCFVEEGAHVVITGRREKDLKEAAAFIGRNVRLWRTRASPLNRQNRRQLSSPRKFRSAAEASPRKSQPPLSSSPPMKVLSSPAWISPSMEAWRRSDPSAVPSRNSSSNTRSDKHYELCDCRR